MKKIFVFLLISFTSTLVFSQNVGIGTTDPKARLHVADSSVVFTGGSWNLPSIQGNAPLQNSGRRMMWYADKGAFRVGAVSSTLWNTDSIGIYSFATGLDVMAKGSYSVAMGVNNKALNWYGFAAGAENTADYISSIAIGYNNVSRNLNAVTIGSNLIAKSIHSIVLGNNNDTSDVQPGLSSGNETDRIFQIGNGFGGVRSNAVTVLRNGKIGIDVVNPRAKFQVANGDVLFTGSSAIPAGPATVAPPAEGAGTRMMWYPELGAFRAGYVNSTQWNRDSIGSISVAIGYNVKAKGIRSVALGDGANANGNNSVSIGRNTLSTGLYDVSLGSVTTASGGAATAIGNGTTASGNSSTSMGNGTTASGNTSTSMGLFSTASGNYATSMGYITNASGTASTSMGYETVASGFGTTAMGLNTVAKSISSLSIGSFNDDTDNPSLTILDASDRIFQIGNGSFDVRGNALTVLRNGKIGIGALAPNAKLQVADGDVLFTGPSTLPASPATVAPPAEGAGTRLMWYPELAAFRAGYVNGTQWNRDSIGAMSIALGYNVKAKGVRSVALGNGATATGEFSVSVGTGSIASGVHAIGLGFGTRATGLAAVSLGGSTTASGFVATSMGSSSIASGDIATSMGFQTVASGYFSTSMGNGTNAKSTGGVAMGLFNDVSDNPSIATPAANDRVFQIGNGSSNLERSNAITVLRNGNTGIGVTNPLHILEVAGAPSATPVTLVIGNKGGFGPAALEFVSDYGLIGQWRPGYIRSNDLGNYTGRLEFYTNGTGNGTLYGNVKGFEVRNGIALTATGTVGSYSDARLKHTITSFTDGLNVINKINPVQFYYNADAPFASEKKQIGIIAQELELLAPYMVEQNKEGKVEDMRTVNNQAYTFLLINAVKEQQTQLEKQAAEIKQQKDELRELKLLVEQLMKK